MTEYYLIRSAPHDKKCLFDSYRKVISFSPSKVTIVPAAVNTVSGYFLEDIFGSDGARKLQNSREVTLLGVTYKVKSSRHLNPREEDGVIWVLSCSEDSMNKIEKCFNARAVVAMSHGITDLDKWANRIGASPL